LDNLTHTLVGVALAEAGLKRRTALGAATLMIGANFPDIDVIAVPLGGGLEWRRGITHGFLALAILPLVLAGLMWLGDRHIRRRLNPSATPADYRQLALLSGVSIMTHPVLDFMNTYGMRWLMPFVNQWYYADGLFIVDAWVLIALVLGVVWSRRDRITPPARVALGALATYTVAMLVITGLGRMTVGSEHPGKRFMVAPTPLVPWRRDVILEERAGYRFGSYSLVSGLKVWDDVVPKGDSGAAAVLARSTPEGRGFLRWARFPYYRVVREGRETVVRILDMRYAGQKWASVAVRLPQTFSAQ
jgi:inner membrane protein